MVARKCAYLVVRDLQKVVRIATAKFILDVGRNGELS